MAAPNPKATGPISQRSREHARRVAMAFEEPLPLSQSERDELSRQSRNAIDQAEAEGINEIKQHTNPATVPG